MHAVKVAFDIALPRTEDGEHHGLVQSATPTCWANPPRAPPSSQLWRRLCMMHALRPSQLPQEDARGYINFADRIMQQS